MKRLAILILLPLLILPTAANAQGPTPTPVPERMYSASSLLEQLGAQPIHITPMPAGLNMANYVIPIAQQAGSGWWTVINLYQTAGAMQIIMVFLMLVLAAALILGIMRKLQGQSGPVLRESYRDARRVK